jgi:hypothetical protein
MANHVILIEHFKLKGSLVSFEVEIKAKQKDVLPVNQKRPNQEIK